MSKLFFALATLLLLLAGCAQSGYGSNPGAGSGSISMYGTVDQGVSITGH